MQRQAVNTFHLTILAYLVLCSGTPESARARTWTVEKDGSGDYTVIQDALDAAAEGDTVRIGPGRYDDFRLFDWTPVGGESYAVVGIHKSNLTVIGADSSQVIIGPETLVEYIDGKDAIGIAVNHDLLNLLCEGLTVENNRLGGLASAALSLRSCRFQYNPWDNFAVDAGVGMTYERCTFANGGGTLFARASGEILRDIVIRHCFFGPFNDVLLIQGVQNATVEHCRFEGNGGGANYVGSTGTVRYSYLDNHGFQIGSTVGADVVIHDCVIESGAQIGLECGSGGRMRAHDNIIGGGVLVTVFADEISSENQVVLTNNDLYNGGGLTVQAEGTGITSPVTLDFSNNYWGTTDTAQIDEWILDERDRDPRYPTRYPIVVYDPIRGRSIPTKTESMGSLKSRYGDLK